MFSRGIWSGYPKVWVADVGRYCLICRSEVVPDINHALVSGEPLRDISARYGFSASALCRHKNAHIPEALFKAYAARQETEPEVVDDLLTQVDRLREKTYSLLERAEQSEAKAKSHIDKDRARRTALVAMKEARDNLTFLAKLVGELRHGPAVNILISAEWVDLRTQILQAVAPYPEAHRAVIEAVSHAEDEA
jgi:hypothetical protein